MTFVVYSRCGTNKNSLQSVTFTVTARDPQDAIDSAMVYLRRAGYKAINIETIQQIQEEKRPWQK